VSAATNSSASPQIDYNGNPVTFIVKPFVGAGGQLYAPVDFFKLIGASYVPNVAAQSVIVILANGKRSVARYTDVQGRCCVAIGPMVEALGGKAQWDPAAKKLTVLGKLIGVTDDGGKLVVQSSFPTTCQIGHLSDPPRVFVDVANTDVSVHTAVINNLSGQAVTIRTGQVSPTVTRIVLDLKRDASCKLLTANTADRLEVALTDAANAKPLIPPVVVAQGRPPSIPRDNVNQHPGSEIIQADPPTPKTGDGSGETVAPAPVNPNGSGDPAAPSSDFKVLGVSFDGDDPSHFLITVSTTGSAPLKTTTLDQPSRLAFDLPGAVLDAAVNKFMPVNESVIKDIRTGIVQ